MSAPDINLSPANAAPLFGGAVRPVAVDTRAKPATWWQAFKRHRLGYVSLIIFASLYLFSLGAELVSNNRPLVVYYGGEFYFPLVRDYPEATFGGNLPISTDYLDPFIRDRLNSGGNFALYPLNAYRFDTLSYYSPAIHHPGAPNAENVLGTDPVGYDVLARIIYGFRISVTFALALTLFGTALGILIGAVQGYFAGKIDLFAQRLIEVWGAMPELYLLIIFASLFQQSFLLLFALMTLFGWVHVSDYVRAEFLRNRQLEYVKAARALGLSSGQIMFRHILPNSLTPVITFLPFRMSAGIMALASLDFLGLGVNNAPSLGKLLLQGKENLDAWWISLSAFTVLVGTMLLLTFIGEALRGALDTTSRGRGDA
ncbi:ABC transporter permease [Niveispirillum sp. KHB5.9]|uniref:ABC transporter permease n=1 Tax=Niveispirillum sp. KHB5.9 TaxID=3400269 RepID=UPI003A870F4E